MTHVCGSTNESEDNHLTWLGRYSIYPSCIEEGSTVLVDAIGQGVVSTGGTKSRFGSRHGNRKSAWSATKSKGLLMGSNLDLNGHHKDYDQKSWAELPLWEHDYVEHGVLISTGSMITSQASTSTCPTAAGTGSNEPANKPQHTQVLFIDSPMMSQEGDTRDVRWSIASVTTASLGGGEVPSPPAIPVRSTMRDSSTQTD